MVTGKTFADVYGKLADAILKHGEEVAPRGMKTKELVQETFCIEEPWNNLAYIEGRNFSLMHAIAESLMLVISCDELDGYTLMNPRMANFSDDGKTLHGAYGYRIASCIQYVVEKLQKDNDTRQAVLTVYGLQDTWTESKDIPCTVALQFTIRHGHLNMHVYMRSNDIIWGTPYDVFVFTNLQMVIANELKMPVGKYYHTATSLHAYESQFKTLQLIANNPAKSIGHYNKNNLFAWNQTASTYFEIANGELDSWENAKNAMLFDMDGSYAFAILMELAYKDYFKCGTADAFLDKNAVMMQTDESKQWIYTFSKRWCSMHD